MVFTQLVGDEDGDLSAVSFFIRGVRHAAFATRAATEFHHIRPQRSARPVTEANGLPSISATVRTTIARCSFLHKFVDVWLTNSPKHRHLFEVVDEVSPSDQNWTV
jgi:hypothetical protein